MHTRTSLFRGLGWFVLANAVLFELVTAWFWHHMTSHNDLAPSILTDALGCTTPSAAYSLGWPLRQTEGRRDFVVVVDYNDVGLYEPDRITLFSPFGGFPVYNHHYDRLDESPRMDRVRAATEDMVRFGSGPAGSSSRR